MEGINFAKHLYRPEYTHAKDNFRKKKKKKSYKVTYLHTQNPFFKREKWSNQVKGTR